MVYKFVYGVLSLIVLCYVLMIYANVPDSIPINFNGIKVIDGYGPKNNLILLGTVPIIFGIIGVIILIYLRQKKDETNIKYGKIFCIAMLVLQDILMFFLVYSCLYDNDTKERWGLENNKIILLLFCLFLIMISIILPKCKMNHVIGVRTKWTLLNEQVWNKTHQIAGNILLLSGFILLLLTLVIESYIISLIIGLTILILDTIILITYSYIIYRKIENKE